MSLPLTNPTVQEMIAAVRLMYAEFGYGDVITILNDAAIYTYNYESLILVDTSAPRIIRLPALGDKKFSVAIKDHTGQASVNPVVIVTSDDSVALDGVGGGQKTLTAPYGSVELVHDGNNWFIKPSRNVTDCGQNVVDLSSASRNAVNQYPAIIVFPRNISGHVDIPDGWNGFSLGGEISSDAVLDIEGNLTII